MRYLFIAGMLLFALVLAGFSAWLRDLDFLYSCAPFLVVAYMATFKRAKIR
jgi:hypothetical protein